MHNNHFEILSSVVKYFATQMKVFPINSLSITLALRPTLTNNHINKPLTSILLKKFVDEIAMFLHTQDSFADYSFIYYSINKLSFKPEWFLSSARLNKCNKGLPKEVVLFSYKIALMEEHKNIFYRTIENDVFFKENFRKFSTITKREKQIMQLLSVGLSSKEIAIETNISVYTVNTHRKNINKAGYTTY